MKVICAGCGTHLGEKPSRAFGDDIVSHGLCKTCAHHFKAQIGMPLAEYLEGIDTPVVTVTPDGDIGTANFKAREFLDKSIFQIMGSKGGDVFECEHATLPGGCGQTVHCSGCTIRSTVMDTVETGNPHYNVPAYLNQQSESGLRCLELLISTEKKGGVVFLKVEEMKPADTDPA